MTHRPQKVPMTPRCPTRKVRYPSKWAATVAMDGLLASGEATPSREPLAVYKCLRCNGGWHFGHTWKRKAQ